MSSGRLPSKVLRPLAGKVILQYVIESLGQCSSVDTVIVATSIEPEDDPIVRFCKTKEIRCFRGSLMNVAERFVGVMDKYGLDCVVRVCGDSPLLDYRLIDQAVNIFEKGDYDLVTNVCPRTYPYGQSVEVIKGETLKRIVSLMSDGQDEEHVTRYLYCNKEEYEIVNFTSPISFEGIHMVVDTLDNAVLMERLIKQMRGPHWKYDVVELVSLLKEVECYEKA